MTMDRETLQISVKKDKETKQGQFRLTCTICMYSYLNLETRTKTVLVEVKERCRRAFEINEHEYIRLYFEDQELRNNDRYHKLHTAYYNTP